MTRILHIETATHVCSVGISQDQEIVAWRETHEPNSHSRLLTVFIEELLQETGMIVADFQALALSLGPGSYTGLRIGTSVIKGLAFGAGLPVIGIDTLQILAAGALQQIQSGQSFTGPYRLRPMIDARRMEVYTQMFDEQLRACDATRAVVLDETSFQHELRQHPLFIFGDGAEKALSVIKHDNIHFLPEQFPSSRFMPALALTKYQQQDFLNTAYFEPFYLKSFIATLPKNKIIPDQHKGRGSDA